MTYIDPGFQKRIDEKLAQLQAKRPLPRSVVTKLKEQFAIEMTYNSNAIEGNKLTLTKKGRQIIQIKNSISYTDNHL